jgi:lipoprotein NlpD
MQRPPYLSATFAVSAVALAMLAGCTTSVPAPVVDRNVRPAVGAQPDPRAVPPATVAPVNPAQPGNTVGSQFHVVQKGETLYGIARVNGVDVNSLSAWNNMAAGVALREGQVLRLSPPLGSAPAVTGAGTTITTIPPSGLIQGQPLPAGTPLPATGAATPSLSPIVTPVEAPLKRDPKAQRVPYSDAALAAMQRGETAGSPGTGSPGADVRPTVPAATASAPTAAATSSVDVEIKPGNGVERDGIAWTWPTAGKVASKFNDKAPMKGIDIAANAGTAVVAAASGKVIYVGKEPRGYGQMIVVNHAKETVSVYFHTDKVQVKEQQRVLLGQKLAEVAEGADNKMHFEVRRQGRPLDPVALMPR